ncbi:MAG: hypothetical protein AAFZ18_15175 [Myxococcota bacterium]
MTDPVVIPSVALLGGALLARDYLGRRLRGAEDRYMALYGRTEWGASEMDLGLRCAPEDKPKLIHHLLDRLERHLPRPEAALLREEADLDARRLSFFDARPGVTDLLRPRRGLYFDLGAPEGVRVVWNHMQTDGVGMWATLRDLFDENPPLIPYRSVPPPPAFVPELLALPSVAQRLAWRGRLRKGAEEAPLERGFARWSAEPLRQLRDEVSAPFNLVTSAGAVHAVFERHPEQEKLTIGLTAYFPFIEGRNKYGVFLCKVRRSSFGGLVQQLERQTRSKMLNWGRSSAQSYALNRLPEQAFGRLVSYYRRQIDVLVSSLPVGQRPITLAGVPVQVSCHPRQLSLPYYFLLVGTRQELHVSHTSRFPQVPDFPHSPALTSAA